VPAVEWYDHQLVGVVIGAATALVVGFLTLRHQRATRWDEPRRLVYSRFIAAVATFDEASRSEVLAVNADAVPPPTTVLNALRKGVTMRNSAAHVGTRHVDADDVERVVNAVSDLLWLFDYYAGEDWAVQHLRVSVQAELGLREPQG
jgi:hypothetical protein